MHLRGASSRQPRAPSLPPDSSADFLIPGFQVLLHQGHELVGDRAVDQAVVVTEREVNDGANGDGIVAFLVGDDQGLLGDAAYAHDGGVGLIDDGQSEDGAELAGVGDRESGAINIFGLELFAAGALAEVGDTALQAQEVEVAGILEDWDNQSPVKGDGDAYVDVAVVADVIAFER